MKLRISSIFFFILIFEVFSRGYISKKFGAPLLNPSKLIKAFYPELNKLNNYQYTDDKINLLVLGGSVVYDGEIDIVYQGDSIKSSFCDFTKLLPSERYNVLSLSASAHNSLDSRYKYALLKDYRFDYVFVYHGINDTRANNIKASAFDKDYRHMEFYDDIYIYFRHPEINYCTSLFVVDWIFHLACKRIKYYIPREFVQSMFTTAIDNSIFEQGGDIKTEEVFHNNLSQIIKMADERSEKVILSTYAWSLDSNYSLAKFKNKELDYDEQLWPTELYGRADNVQKGLQVHNEVIRKIAAQNLSNVVFIDAESQITKGKLFFNDVCHLNQNGCLLLEEVVQKAILMEE